MGKRLSVIAAFLIIPFQSLLAADSSATPIRKDAPTYPVSCYPDNDVSQKENRVDVAFTVDNDGLVKDVRVMRSTDPCFEEAAVSAVRSWVYERRRGNSRRQPPEEMEATFIFDFRVAPPQTTAGELAIETETRALVFDARPIKRLPPRYPDRCQAKAFHEEFVNVQFDVTVEGRTQNIEVIESTNDCFSSSAARSVRKWKYEPKTIDGVPTDRVGVITKIVFITVDRPRRPENVIRPAIVKELNRVLELVTSGDANDALSALAEFEQEYGDSLSPAEVAEFHKMRGLARYASKDFQGALDDFRTAQRLNAAGMSGLEDLVAQLEAALVENAEDR